MPHKAYTKADLENIMYTQLNNLDAINELVANLKAQNKLLHEVQRKVKGRMSNVKPYPVRANSRKKKVG